MEHAEDTSGHVLNLLESYLLAELPETCEFEVESHLFVCAECRAEADVASEVAVALATLCAADVRAIQLAGDRETPIDLVETSTDTAPVGVPFAGRRVTFGARKRSVAIDRSPDRRPGAVRRSSRRFTAVHLASVALGVILAVFGGIGIYITTAPDNNTRVAAGTTSDSNSRRMQVTLTGGDGFLQVRATVVGLQPGTDFELIVVGRDGRNYPVLRSVAAGGPQTIQGNVTLAADLILFFALIQDEAVIVAVAS
ncbi:hypothetical protein ACIBEF_32030 [Micromonospora sp. NPDC050795]|uniref:hypothetical protein n=1 Tax=Micromonospora sp. NPDC050795 TaxID=3364282 RepID=UPI0037899E14